MKRNIRIAKSGTLKRVLCFGLSFIIASLVGSPAFGLDPMGPPASDLRRGESKGGIDFSIGTQDLKSTQGNYTRYVGGVLNTSQKASLLIKDFQTYRAYATVAYSPFYPWEAFLRLGTTNGKTGDEFRGQGEDFDSQKEFAIGGGLRTTFFEELALKIGGLVQVSWSQFDGKVEMSKGTAPDYLEIELFEIQAALGATYMFSDRFSVYGGPFAQLLYGDVDYTQIDINAGNQVVGRYSWDLDNDINYGAYCGAQIMLKRDCSFNIEYQQTSDANAIGASLLWRR